MQYQPTSVPSQDLFKEIESEIFRLLLHNSFPAFQTTPAYQVCLDVIEAAKYMRALKTVAPADSFEEMNLSSAGEGKEDDESSPVHKNERQGISRIGNTEAKRTKPEYQPSSRHPASSPTGSTTTSPHAGSPAVQLIPMTAKSTTSLTSDTALPGQLTETVTDL